MAGIRLTEATIEFNQGGNLGTFGYDTREKGFDGVICRAKADSGAAAPPAAPGAAQAMESLHLALHPALRKCWDGVVASQVCEAFRGDAALTVRRKRLHACAASLEKD